MADGPPPGLGESAVSDEESIVRGGWTMLTVTQAARQCLLSRLDGKKAADDVAMRFTRTKSGWRLRLDRARPDDTAFTCEGRTVLLLDTVVATAMEAMRLEVKNTDAGIRLKLCRVACGSE